MALPDMVPDVKFHTKRHRALLVGMRSMPGNPYDGHTLHETLAQMAIPTECPRKDVDDPAERITDYGYCWF